MNKPRLFLVILFWVAPALVLHGAENLHLNPKLNYSSDSQDGPLITGDHMEDGALPDKANYVIFYGEG